MNNTVISIRTNKELKEQAQKVAKSMGFSLSTLLNAYMHTLVRERKVEFYPAEPITPKMEQIIKKAEEELARGDVIGPFDNVEDMIKSLKS
jgi:addiction module RelB/DinJ family antitoxin